MPDIKLPCDVADKVNAICDAHGNNPGELINILHEAQHLMGYLPEEMQRMIARKLNIPVSKVYGVVTSVDRPGPQDIYTVKAPNGKEYMFPGVDAFLKERNPPEGYITVTPIPGLLDDGAASEREDG